MKPLTREELKGTWATLLLPINSDESIDWRRLELDLDHLTSCGLDGLYAHGTTGEFFAIDEREYERINDLLAERCESSGTAFQIGASHVSAQTCLDRARRAARCEPGAIQVILPDWLKLSDRAVLNFLGRVAEAAGGVPLVLYNPPHAKTVVSPAQYGRLASAVPSLIGVKVAGGGAAWFEEMRSSAPGLAVFVPGHRLASSFPLGAAGSYSNVACLSPDGAARWYRSMPTLPELALDVENRLGVFFAEHVVPLQQAGYPDHALDKYLARIGGWSHSGTRVRWPYEWVDEDQAAAARRSAQRLLPELFA